MNQVWNGEKVAQKAREIQEEKMGHKEKEKEGLV